MLKKLATLCLLCISLVACSTLYQPLRVDEKTDAYPTTVQVDAGGTLVYDTSLDPRGYRYVLLAADSNVRPSVFGFTVRQALAQAGIVRVFSVDEFAQLSRDRGIAPEDGKRKDLAQRFAKDISPVLVVDYEYRFLGDARFLSRLTVTDAKTSKVLLKIDHPRINWVSADTEAMYPVLNQLRRWIKESSKGRT